MTKQFLDLFLKGNYIISFRLFSKFTSLAGQAFLPQLHLIGLIAVHIWRCYFGFSDDLWYSF